MLTTERPTERRRYSWRVMLRSGGIIFTTPWRAPYIPYPYVITADFGFVIFVRAR